VTVLEVIQKGATFLEDRGVTSPRLQTELLLAHVLQVPRLQLYLQFERQLTDDEIQQAREFFRRRGQREPLQHILGTVCFCGLELLVSPSVLIPRPETEILADLASKTLAACGSPSPFALDLGTGSGCLAITLVTHCPTARCLAIDLSPAALDIARQNAARHQVEQRLTFCQSEGFESVPKEAIADLIVSNPPYIPTAEIASLDPEVRDYDPRLALDGGPDGLRFFQYLAETASSRLRPEGWLLVELGDGQADRVAELFQRHNWIVEGVHQDYSGRERILKARWKVTSAPRKGQSGDPITLNPSPRPTETQA